MNTTTIQKWGNSYAVRLPISAIQKLNLHTGNSVEIRESDTGRALSIIPIKQKADSLQEMIARITKKNSHTAADWGSAKGKEVW